jgi:hypothetical protein
MWTIDVFRGAAAMVGLDAATSTRGIAGGGAMRPRICAAAGLAALAVYAAQWGALDAAGIAQSSDIGQARDEAPAGSGNDAERLAVLDRRIMVGGYGGVSYTQPSTVTIRNPGRTDMTVGDFGWLGMPFKSPIYYGLRGIGWPEGSRFGGMIDFTHAKAIANADDVATFTGTADGKPLPPKARIGDTFRHFEGDTQRHDAARRHPAAHLALRRARRRRLASAY